MSEQGRVRLVQEALRGSELVSATIATDTSLALASVDEFDEDGGSFRAIKLADGTEITGTYTAIDEDAETIELAAQIGDTLSAGDQVLIEPRTTDRYAHVELDDIADVPVICRVPYSMVDRLPVGIRDPETGESVIVEEDEGDWVIEDVVGADPIVDTSFVAVTGARGYIYAADQTVASGSTDPITWDDKDFDTHSILPGDSQIIIPFAGKWLFRCVLEIDADNSNHNGHYIVSLRKNAAGNPAAGVRVGRRPFVGHADIQSAGLTVVTDRLFAGDIFEFFFASTAEARVLQKGFDLSYVEVFYQGS